MKDKKTFKKIKFKTRKFLHSTGLAAISCSFENYNPGADDASWREEDDTYFSITNGGDQEVTLYELKDIKKLSAMLSAFVTQVEAVK